MNRTNNSRTHNYTGYITWQILNYYYYICNNNYIDIPPDKNLNNINPPIGFALSMNYINKEILLTLPSLNQRPLKLFINFSKGYSQGKTVNYCYRYCDYIDYIDGLTVNLWDIYLKGFGHILKQFPLYFINIRLVDPLTGFHSLGVWDKVLMEI
jgi:hypothetical protein